MHIRPDYGKLCLSRAESGSLELDKIIVTVLANEGESVAEFEARLRGEHPEAAGIEIVIHQGQPRNALIVYKIK